MTGTNPGQTGETTVGDYEEKAESTSPEPGAISSSVGDELETED